jgi:hypothetical protein
MIPAHINLEPSPPPNELRKSIPPPSLATEPDLHCTLDLPYHSQPTEGQIVQAMTDRVIVGSNTLPSNPTPLSAPQEQQVRDLYYKNVRAKCAGEIEGPFIPILSLRGRTCTDSGVGGIGLGIDGYGE